LRLNGVISPSGSVLNEVLCPDGSHNLVSQRSTRYVSTPGGNHYPLENTIERPGGTRVLQKDAVTMAGNRQKQNGESTEAVLSRGGTLYSLSRGGTRYPHDEGKGSLNGSSVSPAVSLAPNGTRKPNGPLNGLSPRTGSPVELGGWGDEIGQPVQGIPRGAAFKTAAKVQLEFSRHIQSITRIQARLSVKMLYEETYRDELGNPGHVFHKIPHIERCALGMKMESFSRMVMAIHLIKISNFPYGICSYEISSRTVIFKILHGNAVHLLFRANLEDILTEELMQLRECVQVVKKSKPEMRVILLRETWDMVTRKIQSLVEEAPAPMECGAQGQQDASHSSTSEHIHTPFTRKTCLPPNLSPISLGLPSSQHKDIAESFDVPNYFQDLCPLRSNTVRFIFVTFAHADL
jgi:hypothetical protein